MTATLVLAIAIAIALFFLHTTAVSGLNRPAVHPFPDVSLGEKTALRPLADGVFVESSPGVNPGDLVACMRVRINGLSRIKNVKKFALSTRIKVQYAATASYMFSHSKVEVCLHRNASMEVAQCSKEGWRALEKGSWSGAMSPFETMYLDIRTTESLTDVALNISAEEESRPYRYVFLALGMLSLLVAPIVSGWVPFYYSSAMTLGILLVVLILLYQGMKLLPTGRKSPIYLLLYGSLVGFGTVVLHYFSGLVNTILHELGVGDDMFNPVAVFVGLAIILIGAWLGHWGVRKLVLSEDGRIDTGTSMFVKWAIRVVGGVLLLQSSHDGVFAVLLLVLGSGVAWLVGELHFENLEFLHFIQGCWSDYMDSDGFLAWAREKVQLWFKPAFRRPDTLQSAVKRVGKKPNLNNVQLDALKKIPGKEALTMWNQVRSLGKRPNSVQTLDGLSTPGQKEFYSSFHKTPGRKPLSGRDYKATDITEKAVGELVKTPEFQEWWVANVVCNNRVSIAPNEHRQERPEEEIEVTASMPQVEAFGGKYADYTKSFLPRH